MEINSELSVGLKRLSNSSLVSETNFNLILSNLKDYFSTDSGIGHSVVVPESTVKLEIAKEAYAALFCFLVECVRRNVSTESIISLLENSRFAEDKIDRIVSLHRSSKAVIHRRLLSYGIKPLHLYNTSWKMNYCVKSSFSSLEGVPVYYITLDLRDPSEALSDRKSTNRKVTFVCTVEHLEELVSSLRAAVRKINTLASLHAA